MILTGVVAGITVLIGLLVAGGVAFYVVKRKIGRVIRDFATPVGEGLPSPFATLSLQIAGLVGREVAASLKAVFMGVQSVESKNTRRLEADILTGQSPLLTMLMSQFPAVRKRIEKNPELASLALDVAGRVLKGGNHTAPAAEQMEYHF